MGDKSPRSKRRGQQQKAAARAEDASAAKSKQDSHSRARGAQVPERRGK